MLKAPESPQAISGRNPPGTENAPIQPGAAPLIEVRNLSVWYGPFASFVVGAGNDWSVDNSRP
jgi:hypothetical protein